MDEQETEVTQRAEDPTTRVLRVALSDGAVFEMALDAPEAAGVAVGDPVDAGLRAGLARAAERKRLARDVFRLLDRRRCTSRQVRERMGQRGYSAEALDAVLPGFARKGLVDDLEFCRSYCRDQLRRRPVGRGWLRQRLREQGAPETDIEQALDELLDRDAERRLAHAALSSRAAQLSTRSGMARAMRFLRSRGFGESVAREVILDGARARSSAAGADADPDDSGIDAP